MEGEARDRSNGGGSTVDALFRVALARGLRLTTDLHHLDPRPVPGWRILIDQDRATTVEWPHFWPLLQRAPLDLPRDWLDAAVNDGLVLMFVGYGLGMHDGDCHPALQLERAAETGALACGAVPLVVEDLATR